MGLLPDFKPRLLNSGEAAAYLSDATRYALTPRHLTVLRAHNRGPVAEKFERRRYYYTLASLDAFLLEWGINPRVWFDDEESLRKARSLIEAVKSLSPDEMAAIRRTEGY